MRSHLCSVLRFPFAAIVIGLFYAQLNAGAAAEQAPAPATPSPLASAPAVAAPVASAGSISGTLVDQQGKPIAAATIALSGPARRQIQSDSKGVFSFTGLQNGFYSIVVRKSGFNSAADDNLAVIDGSSVQSQLTLSEASFSSLKTIGTVSVSARSANAINTSTASISDVSQSAFIDQGQLNVLQVLNQTPGIVVSQAASNYSFNGNVNGASPLTTGTPQIRGALPYETESLIDGHPLAIGQFGTFNPVFINPYILQDVEVVKGPGSSPPNINYAIGGTVNFRTLEPTRKPQYSADSGEDGYGGQDANVRASGTLDNRLAYVFDYAVQATQGPERGFGTILPIEPINPPIINGIAACTGATNSGGCYSSLTPGPANVKNSEYYHSPYVLCCPNVAMWANQRNELAKLRYIFSPSSALTISYLGGQSHGSAAGAGLLSWAPYYNFTPPAGYAGAIKSGTAIFSDSGNYSDGLVENIANLFQAEYHAALTKTTTLIAREYNASVDGFSGGPGDIGPTSPGATTFAGTLYGGVPLGNNAAPTIFNGVPATVVLPDAYYATRNYDKLNGYTIEVDQQLHNNLLSLSFDQVKNSSYAENEAAVAAYGSVPVPKGSGQSFRTVMLRGQFAITPKLQATLSNYILGYTDHYSQDAGVTFQDSTHSYDAPRLAFQFRASPSLSVRAATGFSIAPPYINLLTNSLSPIPNSYPPQYYTQTINSGDVLPETAFGFDLGFDKRVATNTVLSFDAYQTTLRNQFLQTTYQQGTYTAPPNVGTLPHTPLPLFVQRTENLGHSRYEGLELAMHRAPVSGPGFILQGSLQRGFPYDLPPGFYNTAAGKNTANLAVIPNVNFQGSGDGYNGLSYGRVPYSTGYAEANYRARNGAYFLVGVTYYGPNNSYNEPAFGEVNTSFRQPLSKRASLLLSVSNLTGAYDNFYVGQFTGIPEPLINGQSGFTISNVLGPTTARLTFHVDL